MKKSALTAEMEQFLREQLAQFGRKISPESLDRFRETDFAVFMRPIEEEPIMTVFGENENYEYQGSRLVRTVYRDGRRSAWRTIGDC